MVQTFVKMNGPKVTPMEVSLTDDKVEDVLRRAQSDEDAYVTVQGKVLRRDEKLRSCGLTDGCTIQVTSRMRGGGRSKNKTAGERKKKSSKKAEQSDQHTTEESTPETNSVFEIFDRCCRTGMVGWSAEMMDAMMGMDDEQTERMMRMLRSSFPEQVVGDPEMAIEDIRIFLHERRRKDIDQREEETREAEEQQQQKQEEALRGAEQEQGKRLRFGEEEQSEETRAEGTDERGETSGPEEVRSGRGRAGLVRGRDERCRANETSRQGKGKGHGGKGEHEGKGGYGSKGTEQSAKMPRGRR